MTPTPAGGDGVVYRHNGRQLFVPNRHQFRRLFGQDGGLRQHGPDDLSYTVNLPTSTREGGRLGSMQQKVQKAKEGVGFGEEITPPICDSNVTENMRRGRGGIASQNREQCDHKH